MAQRCSVYVLLLCTVVVVVDCALPGVGIIAPKGKTMRWKTDGSVQTNGWNICFNAQPGGGSSVSCGGHTAASCADCPQGNGAAWCNGACTWDQGTCKPPLTIRKSGKCKGIRVSGGCIDSGNLYDKSQNCKFTFSVKAKIVSVSRFITEAGCDVLTINGKKFSGKPTSAPTKYPTRYPTNAPSFAPSVEPTTPAPTNSPTTVMPTVDPTFAPTAPTPVPTPEQFHIASEGCEEIISASECQHAVFAALPLDRVPLMNSKGHMSYHSIYNSGAPAGCTVANNATKPHSAMSLFIEPRTRPNATKMCQDRELHMCTKAEVSQHWKSLTTSLKETEFLKFFAWVDDGTKSGGDAKMCMVDAAATSAGAAAEEKAAALAQPAAQEKDAKVKPAAQEKDAPALRESAAQASSVGVTANTTNLQVKCGEKLTAIFSTLCCGTVEMWDAVFNPDILGESKDCPFADVRLCPLPSTLQPVCRGPPPTGGEDVSLIDEDLSSSVDEDLSSLDV